MIYGSSALTTDSGKSWGKSKVSHMDYGAADWEDTGKRLLGLRHESGGVLTTSADAGASWVDLDKGFSGCGVVDAGTFVATREKGKGIFRSADAGATWQQVHPDSPGAPVPVVYKGIVYWASGKGILISKDKGRTWAALVDDIDATYGPMFGKDASHLVVVGKSGFLESKDGGKSWERAAPLPPDFGVNRVGPNYAWDPLANVFYASTMTKPTFKYAR